MARVNRREVLSEDEIQVVHCINRCVRRGFLCGVDPVTGRDYEHRRQWIRNRLEFLAGVFGVEVMGFSVMSNHFHVILRTRPDVVGQWSDDEVARRWWELFPRRRNEDGSAAEPAQTDLNAIINDAAVLEERRKRLSSVSWFMRCMSEVIARMANAEEECTGRFWEGRFKAQVLPDEEALAACMVYVDLNPVRAGLAETPEDSDFTSVQERVADLQAAEQSSVGSVQGSEEGTKGAVANSNTVDTRTEHGTHAGWLAPVELDPKRKKVREKSTSRRASNKGCLPMILAEYLQLLDWTGRQLHPGKRGAISQNAPPILERLGTSAELWLHTVRKFGRQRAPVATTVLSRSGMSVDGQSRTRPAHRPIATSRSA